MLFSPFKIYLVSCAKVRDPRGYSIRAGMYEWLVDKHTVVEPVTNNDGAKMPLLSPTKLNTVSFSAIERLRPGVEFDLLAVVSNCSALQYTIDQSKPFREAIVIDQSKNPALFTIWNDFAENEGTTLLHHLHECPVILAKRIGVTEFRSAIRLSTRYQSMILLNPKYVQAATLMKWVEDNEQMLISYTLRSSSASTSSLTLALFEDVVFPISIISDLSSQVHTFPVEGKISLPDRPRFFYLLTCSHYNHFVHIKTKKMVQYFNCKLERMLVPRCHFEVNITNTSDIISAIVSETIAETMLSLTSEQIYEVLLPRENRFLLSLQINSLLINCLDSSYKSQATDFPTKHPVCWLLHPSLNQKTRLLKHYHHQWLPKK